MLRSLPITLLISAAIVAVGAPAANAATAGTSGASAGKVHYSDLSVMISLEKASPLLNLAATGKRMSSLELTFRAPAVEERGDDRMQDYLTITLEDVMVSSHQISGDGRNIRLSLNFTRYFVSDSSGTGKTMAAEVLAAAAAAANASYLEVKLPDVLVTSYQSGGHEG